MTNNMGGVVRMARSVVAYELFKQFMPEVEQIPPGEFDSQLRMAIFSAEGNQAASVSTVVARLSELTTQTLSKQRVRLVLSQAAASRGPEFSAALQARVAHKVPVMYVTNRNIVEGKQLGYGPERGANVSYGVAEVSIPEDHKYAGLESPNIWKLEFP